MEISVDRIVLSGDSVSWKENMSDIERRNLCSALIYPEEKEKGGESCTPINRRIHRAKSFERRT